MTYRNTHVAPDPAQRLIDDFLDTLRSAGQREQTILTRRRQLVRLFLDGSMDPLTVSTTDLTRYFAARAWSPETRKSNRACVRCFFRWLQTSGRRTDDPAAALPAVRVPEAQPRPCPDRHVLAALEHATDEESIMVRAAAEYGMRRGEISRLHSDDVIDDAAGRSIIVHGKGGKTRTLPLDDDFAGIILAADGYVFPGRWGGHVEESYVGKRLSRLLPQGWGGHTLRHRFATTAYAQTHDILAVSRALGHASVATTQRYVAVPADALRGMLDATRLASQSV